MNAAAFRPIVVTYRRGAPVRLDQVANVIDSIENVMNGSWFYTKPGGPTAPPLKQTRDHAAGDAAAGHATPSR